MSEIYIAQYHWYCSIWQISSYYKRLPYVRNLANWFPGKSL